jgi:hypothetical protein
MWVVLLPNDVLTVTILPESLYEARVILPPYTSVISFQAPRLISRLLPLLKIEA